MNNDDNNDNCYIRVRPWHPDYDHIFAPLSNPDYIGYYWYLKHHANEVQSLIKSIEEIGEEAERCTYTLEQYADILSEYNDSLEKYKDAQKDCINNLTQYNNSIEDYTRSFDDYLHTLDFQITGVNYDSIES